MNQILKEILLALIFPIPFLMCSITSFSYPSFDYYGFSPMSLGYTFLAFYICLVVISLFIMFGEHNSKGNTNEING